MGFPCLAEVLHMGSEQGLNAQVRLRSGYNMKG
jgi:hypothetical protein